MKILLTNDDGYEAENIKNLYEKLSQDHEVWIIAPKDNCSGMSAAISYLKEIPVDKFLTEFMQLMELQQIVVILVC